MSERGREEGTGRQGGIEGVGGVGRLGRREYNGGDVIDGEIPTPNLHSLLVTLEITHCVAIGM